MKRAAVNFLSAVLLSTPALAADIPARPMTGPVSAYDWTGFYAGMNAGYGWGELKMDVLSGGSPVATDSIGFDGFLGGVQVGANAQYGSMVLGVEADIQATAQEGTRNFVLPGPTAASLKLELPWFATFRARAGVANGASLLYVTGGFFYAEGKVTATIGGVSASASDSETGWVLGAGYESAIAQNWTWRLEYLYADTGSRSEPLGGGLALRSQTNDHIVRLGLNYRFGS